ncbi:MAG: hypothetical protein HeimC2_27810 [Candidatus Heimdallarchaeota archaeon LC_2]|nr:MAG: hypothetical protein HeimC2_27810 [Candidatus Heimdallarchaeota archaeon LC_2]
MEILQYVDHIIQNILGSHFPEDSITINNSFERILGGADTEIFSFSIKITNQSNPLPLVLRLYREGAVMGVSKREFETLDQLYNAGLSVPKPYGYADSDNKLKRPFLIMELIVGEMLSEIFFNSKTDVEALMLKFIQNLVNIHNVNWKDHLSILVPPDIKSDPYQVIKRFMRRPVELIEQYNINELKPLITWLQKHLLEHPLDKIVLIHGDYHAMNVMVKENGDLVTIDWTNIILGDRRVDIAFTIVAMGSASDIPLKENLVKIYEEITQKKIEGIEFFMVLSVLFNLMRVYSMLFNYEITNENDMTKATMIGEYGQYVKYFVNMIKEVTGLEFPQIEKKLEI